MIDSTGVVTKMHRNRIACVVQHSEGHISNARIFSVCRETIHEFNFRDTFRARALEVIRSVEMS
jgi:hypothetical protein